MNLQEILNCGNSKEKKIGVSLERIQAVIPQLRQYIQFWREYPDLFVDFLSSVGGNPENFHLYTYQRIMLRIVVRYRKTFVCLPRGASKSFIVDLAQMVRCVLFPGANLYCVAAGKNQSASILSEKVELICKLIPAFRNELRLGRGKGNTVIGKDYCKYVFKNGSTLDNVVASEKSRGLRRQGRFCVLIRVEFL